MTVTTVRATADSSSGGLTYTSGTTTWNLVDDSPADDATYVRLADGLTYPSGAVVLGLGLGAITLTANQKIKAVRHRARIRLNSSSPYAATITIAFRGGDGVEDFAEPFSSASLVVAERTGVWRTAPPIRYGTAWDLNGLYSVRTSIAWYYSSSYHVNLRLSEYYCDVDIRDRPVVSGVTVTGATSTTQPTVSWTYTANADGDPQKSFRVKVYSAAQYGAAGFSPDTSTPVWDSGVVSGAGTSIQIGQALTNGTTYQAYVEASQDFNGSTWFSAWANSSATAMALVTPAAPALTVASDSTVPNLRNVLTVVGNLNLLSADDSSLDTTIGSWVNDVNATVARTTAQAAYGVGALSMTAASAATMSAHSGQGASGTRVVAGATYTFLASFRAAATPRTVKVGARWYDRSGTVIGTVTYGTGAADTTSGWTEVSYTAAAPTNAVYVSVVVQVTSPANAEVHYVDKIMAGPSGSAWSPGGLLSVVNTIVERAVVTAGPRNIAHPQLAGGGDTLASADGFYTTGALSRAVYDAAQRYAGGGSIRWDVNNATSKLYVGWIDTTNELPSPVYPLVGVPGTVYTFGIYAKVTAGTFSTQLNLQAIDARGNAVGSPTSNGGMTLGTGWVLYTATITMPAGACYVRPHLDNTGSVTEKQVYVDAAQWVAGATADTVPGQPMGVATAWEPVRGGALGDLLPSGDPGDQTYTLFDREAPPGAIVVYRAYNYLPESANVPALASGYTATVPAALTPPGAGVWVLRNALVPGSAMAVHVTGPSLPETVAEQTGVFYPLRPGAADGSGQRPVILSDYLGGQDGSLTLLCDSEAEWLALRSLLLTPGTLWLVFPEFGGRHIRVTGRAWDRTTPRTGWGTDSVWRRTVKVDYVETDRAAL